jgi:hypothetical protein
MAKVFYTERDIVDMVNGGILSLEINDSVGLTDLAYEKANRLGLKLVRDMPDNPPAAPIRPYLSQPPTQKLPEAAPVRPYLSEPFLQRLSESTPITAPPNPTESDLQQRIRSAVLTQMGSQVDPALLDAIIKRVLDGVGVK